MLRMWISLVILIGSAPAYGALPSDASRCQRGVGKATERLLERSLSALADCGDRLARGVLPPQTDCYFEAADRLRRARERFVQRIETRCSDAVVGSLIFAPPCEGMSEVGDLVTCLAHAHEAEADRLFRTLYPLSGAEEDGERACRRQTSKQVRRFANRRLRWLNRCRDRAAKGKLPAGQACEEEPKTAERVARLHASTVANIVRHCGGAELSVAMFGVPCGAPLGPEHHAHCAVAAGQSLGDRSAQTVYGEEGFCGAGHQAVEARIEALLAQMTLEEKVEQMHGSSGLPMEGAWLTADNDRLGIPGLRFLDGPRGVSVVAGNATAFPVGSLRGATWDPELEERVGDAMGRELRAKGAGVLLAPTINILSHPRWGRAQETYGEDPLHLGRMGVGFIRGVQRHGVASAKHYAANNIEDTRFTVNVELDERTLREIYLPHFRMAVEEAHTGSVMSAYNLVRGLYAAENPELLSDILRGDWGFRGLVESDWYAGTRSTVPSALAGLDIEMPVANFYGPALLQAVLNGDVPESVIDAAVRRILRVKLCFAFDSDPPLKDPNAVETPQHLALAREVAQKGIVLLENDGILPLDAGTLASLALVGALSDTANIGDRGSSSVNPTHVVTPLEGIQTRAPALSLASIPTDVINPADEAAIAAAAAAVVVVGLQAADEGEGLVAAGDRESLQLSSAHTQLIQDVRALNSNTIVVLTGSGALEVESWFDEVAALLWLGYPGQQGGHALADVLFGDMNPSGRLPAAWPRSEADLPAFINDQNQVTYDYFHGYRHLDRQSLDPRYPFGFGRSYTNFTYSNLQIVDDTLVQSGLLQVRVDLANTGSRAGAEVAQLYVSYLGSSVERAERDLKDFQRVELLPGETRTLEFDIPVRDLAYYDAAAGAWMVEPLTYGVHVGPSSRDLPLSNSFEVRGPNFVLILADDLGYQDLGLYGSTEIATPHLDTMAEQGVYFSQYYAGNSICSPSRAGMLTGRYSLRTGVVGTFFPDSTGGLDPNEITIAEVLKGVGYQTGLIGKWHLGHLPQYQPNAQGFDYWWGTPYSNDMHAPVFDGGEPNEPCFVYLPECVPRVPIMEDGVIIEAPAMQETLTRRYAQKSIEFMRGAAAADEPFFLYYASNFPHVPLYASEDFLGRSAGGLYGDVVEELDWSVGQITSELRRLGLGEDSLVIFASDNGPWLLFANDNEQPQGGLDGGSAGPLRNGKSTSFEGGARVPSIVRWPAGIPAGRRIDAPATAQDWLPTFAKLAGAEPPQDRVIDGKNIAPLLAGTGERDPNGAFRWLVNRSNAPEVGAYIEGPLKLKLAVDGGESVYTFFSHDDLLFSLPLDTGEEFDLAPLFPAVVDDLKGNMQDLIDSTALPVVP